MRRAFLIVMMIVNAVVLLGQLWPEGAPPFARIVNVAFLAVNVGFLGWSLRSPRVEAPPR